jgi:hypothetical protein
MPSYILFLADRRELRLKCSLCGNAVLLTTAAHVVDGQVKPDPELLVAHHYRGDHLAKGRCPKWNGESQDFYVKDPTRKLKTRKFSWPKSDEEEDYEYFIHCSACGAEEGYSGPTDVGPEKMCEICDHPLVKHEIMTSAAYGDPVTGEFALPQFR